MTALKTGAVVQGIAAATIDSILPVTLTANTTLIPGTHAVVQADPTGGTFTLTYPDAASNAGVSFFIKRISNGDNTVVIESGGSDSIDTTVNGYKLSLVDEYFEVYSDGSTVWRIKGKDLFAISTITASSESFVATTSLVKFNSWDTVIFSTPDKLVGDLPNDSISVEEFQGSIADGYTVNVTFNCEYTNNNIVTMQLYLNGMLTGIPVSANALGNGKPITLSITQQVATFAVTELELHVSVENAGTITDINALMQIQRIGR